MARRVLLGTTAFLASASTPYDLTNKDSHGSKSHKHFSITWSVPKVLQGSLSCFGLLGVGTSKCPYFRHAAFLIKKKHLNRIPLIAAIAYAQETRNV
jgi:hypothetical protein